MKYHLQADTKLSRMRGNGSSSPNSASSPSITEKTLAKKWTMCTRPSAFETPASMTSPTKRSLPPFLITSPFNLVALSPKFTSILKPRLCLWQIPTGLSWACSTKEDTGSFRLLTLTWSSMTSARILLKSTIITFPVPAPAGHSSIKGSVLPVAQLHTITRSKANQGNVSWSANNTRLSMKLPESVLASQSTKSQNSLCRT